MNQGKSNWETLKEDLGHLKLSPNVSRPKSPEENNSDQEKPGRILKGHLG